MVRNISTYLSDIFSGKPDPCEKIEVLEITKNSATVGWVKPARDGGAKIDGYVIEYVEVKPPAEPPAPVEVCLLIKLSPKNQLSKISYFILYCETTK